MALFISGSEPNAGSVVEEAEGSAFDSFAHAAAQQQVEEQDDEEDEARGAQGEAPASVGAPVESVHDALSAVRPVVSAPPALAPAAGFHHALPAYASHAESDALDRDAVRSVVLVAPPADADSVAWSGHGSLLSQRSANSARSILNSNPANRARSVVMHFDGTGSIAGDHDAIIADQVRRLRASLGQTQQLAVARRKAEDSALANLQPQTWTTLVQLALDAVCARAQCTRDAFGWDRAQSGAACMERLRDTMGHLRNFCQRRHSGQGPQVHLDASLLRGNGDGGDQGLLAPHLKSLSVAWMQDVRLRQQRLDRYFADCERAFADFLVTAKGAAKSAWEKHLRLLATVQGMKARLASAREAQHAELADAATGELPDRTMARLDTESAVSKVAQPLRVQQRVVDAGVATQLRNRSDRLATTIQVLLRQQLQAAKNKTVLLASMGVEGGQLPSTLARVRALDTEVAALGEEIVRVNAEREEVEKAWAQSQDKTLTLDAAGAVASTSAQRLRRHALRTHADGRAQRLAVVNTVLRALHDKLHAEATAVRTANFQHLATTLMEAHATLAQRVDAARVLREGKTLQLRGDLQRIIADLERDASVRGGHELAVRLRTASHNAVAQHMTQRVKQHLERVDMVVKDLLTFVHHMP